MHQVSRQQIACYHMISLATCVTYIHAQTITVVILNRRLLSKVSMKTLPGRICL